MEAVEQLDMLPNQVVSVPFILHIQHEIQAVPI
jgi:hypothetical protein